MDLRIVMIKIRCKKLQTFSKIRSRTTPTQSRMCLSTATAYDLQCQTKRKAWKRSNPGHVYFYGLHPPKINMKILKMEKRLFEDGISVSQKMVTFYCDASFLEGTLSEWEG